MTLATLWTVARQASLSMGFSGKNIGVGCHLLLQGIFPTQGWKTPISYIAGRFFTTEPSGLLSNIILLHADIRFCQKHFLKGLSFPRFVALAPLLSVIWPGAWAFPYGLCSVPLVHSVCLYTSTALSWFLLLCVVYFEIRIYEAPNFVLLFKDYFGCL